MTVADIITEYGAYYRKNPENMRRIFSMLLGKTTTSEVLTPIVTEDTLYQAAKTFMTRVLQPFQKTYTPIDPLTVKPAKIQLYEMKVDIQETPHDYEAMWLGFLTGEDIDVKKWPFVRWFIEKYILPQLKQDYERNEVYKGVHALPTPGTPGAAGTAMNGIGKVIADAITAGEMVPIVTGAPSATNTTWVDQVEAFADAINTNYWGVPMNLCMSQALERRFHRGYKAKYGKDTDYRDSKGQVEFTNLTIVGLPSMNGRNRIWCTPPENAVRLIKKPKNMEGMQVENVDRTLKMYTDFWSGVGFLVNEAVFVNDQV